VGQTTWPAHLDKSPPSPAPPTKCLSFLPQIVVLASGVCFFTFFFYSVSHLGTRPSHSGRQALPNNYKPKFSTSRFQSQDYCSKGDINRNFCLGILFLSTLIQLYCVRPNSGRVEPGESVDVSGKRVAAASSIILNSFLLSSVMLQPLKEEPPLNSKCKDKFLVQSTFITPDKETMALHDLASIKI